MSAEKHDKHSKDGMTNLNEDMNFHKHDEKSFKRMKTAYGQTPKKEQKIKNQIKSGIYDPDELD